MKMFLGLFLVFVFAGSDYAQKPKTPTPQAAIAETPALNSKQQLTDLQAAKNVLFTCYDDYYNKDKSDNKLQTLRECSNSAVKQLAEIYSNISKNPDALELLLADELESNYRYLDNNKPDTKLDSQINLQRIIVLQNQRIIGLLEKLLSKK